MRKRRIICLFLTALLFLMLCTAASAADAGDQLGYVTDAAGYLSESETAELEELARQISEKHSCGVYIVVLNDYEEYSRHIETCAEELYQYFHMGWGEDHDGVLLIMSMKQREYDIAAYGDFGNYAFTDYGKEYLSQSFLDNFRRDDWYGGFRDYLNTAENMLASAREGEPLDLVIEEREPVEMSSAAKLLFAVLPSSAAAFLVCGRDKRKMKTAVSKRTAEEYVIPGSVHLYLERDQFINRTRTVQIIQEHERSSGHSGGGTTVNSAGFSHHSGKF